LPWTTQSEPNCAILSTAESTKAASKPISRNSQTVTGAEP
ncbi:MAG: hypothetical protein ACI8RC_003013, partial [Ilumatobacter sp.]